MTDKDNKRLLSYIDSLDPGSDELEEEICRYINQGYKDQEAVEDLNDVARHFADWQKQQMTRLAISAEIVADLDPHGADYGLQKLEIGHNELELLGIKNGTKVKIIVIKED